MKICIQDPSSRAIYLLSEVELEKFAVNSSDDSFAADVLFVCPTKTLIQELPPSRLTDSVRPTVQILDPDNNLNWVIKFDDLKNFQVPVPPSNAENLIWFAMPSAKDILAAVPAFRLAMVQHSS